MANRNPRERDAEEAAELLQHLDSAYNLARWLVRNDEDAEDIVQEAYLRAFQYSASRRGNARAWLLTIVRNTSYTWLKKKRARESHTEFDEDLHSGASAIADPEQRVMQIADAHRVGEVLGALPVRFREALVLRELEGLSYNEIAEVMGVPRGTVMSMLSRARARFREKFGDRLDATPLGSNSPVDRCA